MNAVLATVGPFSSRKAADLGELTLLFDTGDMVLESLTTVQQHMQSSDSASNGAEAPGMQGASMPASDAQDMHRHSNDPAAAHCEALIECITWVLKAVDKALTAQHSDSSALDNAIQEFIADGYLMLTQLCLPKAWEAASQVCLSNLSPNTVSWQSSWI